MHHRQYSGDGTRTRPVRSRNRISQSPTAVFSPPGYWDLCFGHAFFPLAAVVGGDDVIRFLLGEDSSCTLVLKSTLRTLVLN